MNCLKTFAAEIDEIIEIANLHKYLREVLPRSSYLLENDSTYKSIVKEKKFVGILSKMKSRSGTEYKALYALAWGTFEEFVRKYVRECVDLYNNKNTLTSKKSKIWSQHAIVCSQAIINEIKGTKYKEIDMLQVSIDLQKGIHGDDVWKLNGEALSNFGGKFEENQLEYFGERIGVDLSWRQIGDCENFKSLSGKRGANESGNWACSNFCRIRNQRNCFAHEGVGVTDCVWEDLIEATDFLLALANQMADRAGVDLK